MSARTSRRGLGIAGGYALMARLMVGQAHAAELDGELIRRCDDFIVRDKAWAALLGPIDALPDGPKRAALQARCDALHTGYRESLNEIASTPASSPQGVLAKARAIAQEWGNDPPPDTDMAWSLIQDLLGRG